MLNIFDMLIFHLYIFFDEWTNSLKYTSQGVT